ncbi:hypothetical protein [Solidesulfovibrio sp.]
MPQHTQHYEAASVTQALALIAAKDRAMARAEGGKDCRATILLFGNGGLKGYGPEHFGIGPDSAA